MCIFLMPKIRSLRTSLAVSSTVLLLFYALSAAKKHFLGVPLLGYDARFIGLELTVLSLNDWRVLFASIIAAGALAACALIYIRLPFQPWNRVRFLALGLLATSGALGSLMISGGPKPHELDIASPSVYTFAGMGLLSSFNLAPEPVPNEVVITEPVSLSMSVTSDRVLPHIVFVLEESTISPAQVPAFQHSRNENLFVNTDMSRSGKLQVSTFGGGTWLTEFALAVQFHPRQLGLLRDHVTFALEGRIDRSIYTLLSDLGYENAVLYPAQGIFVNSDRFYASIGIDRFYDPASAGFGDGRDWTLPDRTFFDFALTQLERQQPQALLVFTIAQHGPHDGDDPAADYLQRFADSDRAYGEFVSSAQDVTERPIVFIAFGDHQPTMMADLESAPHRYETSFQVQCTDLSVCDLSSVPDAIDVTLLASMLFNVLGFERDSLMKIQDELFAECRENVAACSEDVHARYNWHVTQQVLRGD